MSAISVGGGRSGLDHSIERNTAMKAQTPSAAIGRMMLRFARKGCRRDY